MALHNDIGKEGENHAELFLHANDYKILEKNYRYDKAEIDIIAKKDKQLIFIEVKTRSSTYFGAPEQFLSEHQQRRINKAALHYIEQVNWESEIRFDIISIVKGKELTHIKDAFFIID